MNLCSSRQRCVEPDLSMLGMACGQQNTCTMYQRMLSIFASSYVGL